MRMGSDGQPEPGMSMRTLGVRVRDIHPRLDGTVDPKQGGLSVSPTPEGLPRATRPAEIGGVGKDPVFEIETDELPEELSFRKDPNNPDMHGFIEPAYPMKFEHYQRRIRETSALWIHVLL